MIIEGLLTRLKTMDVYMRRVEIIKKINTRIIINLKRRHYNDNICKLYNNAYLLNVEDDLHRLLKQNIIIIIIIERFIDSVENDGRLNASS